MSIIKDMFKKPEDPDELKPKDMMDHHCFGGELMADGFIAPIVLPKNRIQELLAEDSMNEMVRKTGITELDIERLLRHDFLEPSHAQYMALSRAYHVSVFWLMGYHTYREHRMDGKDRAISVKLAERNAAENRRYTITKEKGMFGEYIRERLEKRVAKLSLDIANLAARITAKEHLPLSDEELYILDAHPVFLEYSRGDSCWGLCKGDQIITVYGTEEIEQNGEKYHAYLTPNTAITFEEV